MSTGTLLFAVKTALLDAMQRRPTMAGTQISYGEPASYKTGTAIWFGPAESLNDPSDLGGRRAGLDEIVTMTVVIQAFTMQTEGQQTADEQAVALFAEFQALIAENASSLVEGVWGCYVNSWIHHVGPAQAAGSGYLSRFEVQVQFRGTLR